MGRNKAFLPFGDATLIEAVIARLREACGDLLLVTTAPDAYRHLGLPMVSDALPHGRSLAGIYTGVLHARGPAFICGCDMPFLNPALIRYLGGLSGDADVVIPAHGGVLEPLHAVYTPACREAILRCLERGGSNVGFLPDVRVRVVEEDELRRYDPALRSFVNVNTPSEYESALAEAGHRAQDAPRAGPAGGGRSP